MRRGKTYRDLLHLLHVVLPYRGQDCLVWPFQRNEAGYGTTVLAGKGVTVSREVCWATHGAPPSDNSEARHLCGRGHEGCVAPAHLVWGSPSQNQQDRVDHGTSSRGEQSGRSRLTEADVREIRRLLTEGKMRQVDIAAQFEVSQRTISSIAVNRTWYWLR